MIPGIVDSTVIVHLFRRDPLALAWYSSLAEPLGVTPITWMEIISGAGSKAKQAKCKTILDLFVMTHPVAADLDWAMEQLERFRLSHGATMNDCLIASVAYRLRAPLYTHNLKDMHVLLGTSLVVKPY
jgi:predicted nucleic acid-binding protein